MTDATAGILARALAAACAGLTVLVWPSRERPGARLERLLGRRGSPAPGLEAQHRPRLAPGPVSALAALAGWLLVGGAGGIALAAVVMALLPRWLSRLEPAAARAERLRIVADLPLAVALLATCVTAGATPAAALASVGEAVDGPLGRRLDRVAATMRLGGRPAAAWGELLSDEGLAPLARSLVRSLDSGAPMGPLLDRTARDLRARRRAAAEAAARAVGVRAVVPLGACFLPAFVLLGVAPTVWAVASQAFAHGA